jgi:Rieske 2Fe-2S family protein
LEGELLSVPEEKKEFPNLNKKKLCLHKAKVAIWRGIIWVNANPNAESIETWFKGVEEKLGPHKPEELIEDPVSATDHVINANWKIVVENYIDIYHLSHLHSNTLQMYDHKKNVHEFVGPHYTFWEPLAGRYKKNLDDLLIAKRVDGFTDETLGAYVPFLFPSLGLAESETTWSIFQVIPLAVDKTQVITRTKYVPSSSLEQMRFTLRSSYYWEKIFGSKTKYPDNESESDPMNSGDFMAEDIFACEQQQKSFESPLFEVGASAELGEYPVRKFQEVVAKRMTI